MGTIKESSLPNLIYRGKVRDTHDLGDNKYLMVATDRISVFDVVLPTAIANKGTVLNQISSFWFSKTSHIIPNHLINLAEDQPELNLDSEYIKRSMVVKKAKRIDVECVVRGYITGSAWSEYKSQGTVSGIPINDKLVEGDAFPEPIFTPTTKADVGHDENMSYKEVEDLVGVDVAAKLKELTLSVYKFAHDYALSKDIIIADTKMEFGFINDQIHLIDELLTPDSSRFWDATGYSPGKSQPNFDKQFVRDYTNSVGWDHEPPAPELPEEIVEKTTTRYLNAFKRLTGSELEL